MFSIQYELVVRCCIPCRYIPV